MQSLKLQGIQAFSWDLLGKISIHIIGLLTTIILARLLEPSDFGQIAMIMVVIGIATIFSDIGLGGALIQKKRVLPIHYTSVFYFNMFMALLLTLVTFFSAKEISNFYNDEKLLLLTQVLSILFLLTALHSVQSIILRKHLNHKLLTKININASLISGVIGVICAFSGMGVWSLIIQILLRELLINLFIWKKATWIPTLSFSFKALKKLWHYGFHMFLAGFINNIYERLDYLFIGKLFSPSTLGFFHQAKQLNTLVIKYSSGSLTSVLFPLLSKIQNDLPRFQKIVLSSLGIICFITFFLLGTLYLTAYELILLLFGEKWIFSVHYFEILALSGFAYPISALMVNVLSSRGESKKFLQLEIYKKIIQSINFYILYLYSIEMFLYGIILTSFINTLLNIGFAVREIQLSFWKVFKPIVLQMIITIAIIIFITFILQNFETYSLFMLLLKSFLFFTLYVAANILLKTEAYQSFSGHIIPVIQTKLKRENHDK